MTVGAQDRVDDLDSVCREADSQEEPVALLNVDWNDQRVVSFEIELEASEDALDLAEVVVTSCVHVLKHCEEEGVHHEDRFGH